jgi:hypothetical protein
MRATLFLLDLVGFFLAALLRATVGLLGSPTENGKGFALAAGVTACTGVGTLGSAGTGLTATGVAITGLAITGLAMGTALGTAAGMGTAAGIMGLGVGALATAGFGWMGAASTGTCTSFPHFGQRNFLPAALSSTFIFAPQAWHAQAILISLPPRIS